MLLSELEECVPDHRTDMEDIWDAKQTAAALNRFLNTLQAQDCRIFLCRYYYNLTLREIAEKYDIPQRRVKYRLSCMRAMLRKQLAREGICV